MKRAWTRCILCHKWPAMGKPYQRDICRHCHAAKLLRELDAIIAKAKLSQA